MIILSHTEWMASLAEGEIILNFVVHASGMGTYQGWSGFQNRILPYHIIYYFVGGGMIVELPKTQERITVQAGSMFILNANVEHTFSRLPNHDAISAIHFRFQSYFTDGSVCRFAPDCLYIENAQSLRHDAERLHQILRYPNILYRDAQLKSIALLFFADVFANHSTQSISTLNFNQQRKLNKFIHEHVHERLSSVELAQVVGLSQDYFTRLFKQTYGMSPRKKLVHERIHVASTRLVETQQTITEIAEGLGYTDIYLFSRQFKQITGLSPRKFRQQYQ